MPPDRPRAGRRTRRSPPTPVTSIRGRASTSSSARSRSRPACAASSSAAIRARPIARACRALVDSLELDARVTITGLVPPSEVRAAPRRRRRARAAEHRVGDLRALHVAAEAVRVPDARPADRRVGSAGHPRSADRRRARRCSCRRAIRAALAAALSAHCRRPGARRRARARRRAALAPDYTWARARRAPRSRARGRARRR